MGKVTYRDAKGKMIEVPFATEEEGRKLKVTLKKAGVQGAKWEW